MNIRDALVELVAAFDAPAPKGMEMVDCYAHVAAANARMDLAWANARAALAEEGPSAWRPIETAPKDGREVILAVKIRAGISHGILVGHCMPGGHCIEDHPPIAAGWYFWTGCQFDKASEPTHWMPMPHHPAWEPGGWQARKQDAAIAARNP